MKLVRKLAATLVLACALTVTVYAGDQNTPPIVPPTPPATYETSSDKTLAPSDNDGGVVPAAEEPDLLIAALMALLSVF